MSEESAVDEADRGATDRSGNMTSTAAIVLVVAAVGLAGWAALRPPSTAARDAAVAKACTAFDVVRTGVDLNTSTLATGGPAMPPKRRPWLSTRDCRFSAVAST